MISYDQMHVGLLCWRDRSQHWLLDHNREFFIIVEMPSTYDPTSFATVFSLKRRHIEYYSLVTIKESYAVDLEAG